MPRGIVISDNQETLYPSKSDEIILVLKRNDEFRREYTTIVSDPDYVVVEIESDELTTGQYVYDVILRRKDKTYHIVNNKELYVIGGIKSE